MYCVVGVAPKGSRQAKCKQGQRLVENFRAAVVDSSSTRSSDESDSRTGTAQTQWLAKRTKRKTNVMFVAESWMPPDPRISWIGRALTA